MPEQDLEITKNGEYNNLSLKNRVTQSGEIVKGIDPGNFIIVEKLYPEGRQVKTYQNGNSIYSCSVKYKGEQCSFILNEREHEAYTNIGGQNDKIKIAVESVEFTAPDGTKTKRGVLRFSKVE